MLYTITTFLTLDNASLSRNLLKSTFLLEANPMRYRSIIQQVFKWLLLASVLNFGLAIAQTEPTLNQVYATAQAGKLDQAQLMIQQVLISHPNSAKAFFVQSELYARQGELSKARGAFATAEKLAPTLPFAKPEAVQALRSQLTAKNTPAVVNGPAAHSVAAVPATAPPASSSSWLLPL
jgi:tetratricopeptide (TPR) repeat protein